MMLQSAEPPGQGDYHFSLKMYSMILFSFKKEESWDTYYNIDELWWYYTDWNKLNTQWQILYESAYMRYLEQANS